MLEGLKLFYPKKDEVLCGLAKWQSNQKWSKSKAKLGIASSGYKLLKHTVHLENLIS